MAGRTNDSAGDGTTTASVLARDMIHFGLQVSCLGHLYSKAIYDCTARAASRALQHLLVSRSALSAATSVPAVCSKAGLCRL